MYRSCSFLFVIGKHWACLFTEWTPASPAKSIVSQIKPRSRQCWMMLDATSHEAWIWGFTMDLPCLPVFAKFVMLETFGNVDILGLDIESSGLNSAILRLREVHAHISVFWSLNIFNNINNVFYGSHDRCLENPSLCYLHGLSASWYQSGQCNDTTEYKRPFRFPRILH